MKHIVTIGGGTGQFHVLRALTYLDAKDTFDITAIPTTIDSGGSSGELRLQCHIVAPGDISQCIFGLHPEPEQAAWLFEHRFNGGKSLDGHTARNIIVAAALQKFGPNQKAIDVIRDTFCLKGNIAPITFSESHLNARLHDGTELSCEEAIYKHDLVAAGGVDTLWLEPEAVPNPAALTAILNADVIIVCPGTLVCSIIPNFLVQGMKAALTRSRAKKIYISNLMNRKGHVDDSWTVLDHVEYLESYLVSNFFDTVIANTQKPIEAQTEFYRGDKVATPSFSSLDTTDRTLIGVPLLMPVVHPVNGGISDSLNHFRASIRHDPRRLGNALKMVLSELG